MFFRANALRPGYHGTLAGVHKARDAVENALSKARGFDFSDMEEAIKGIEEEERRLEEERKAREHFRRMMGEDGSEGEAGTDGEGDAEGQRDEEDSDSEDSLLDDEAQLEQREEEESRRCVAMEQTAVTLKSLQDFVGSSTRAGGHLESERDGRGGRGRQRGSARETTGRRGGDG